MSGVFKSIGKVFKKVATVVKKVAVPAMIIGAIVLTGGAAIGALPALGTMLGSIGITGTMAGVLGGAISSAAIGAVANGAMAAATGGDVWKAGIRGGVIGGVTGGVLGGAGLISPNGVLSDMGIGSQASHLKGLANTGTLGKFAPSGITQTQYNAATEGVKNFAGNTTGKVAGLAGGGTPALPLQNVPLSATGMPAPLSTGPVGSQVGGIMGQGLPSLTMPTATTASTGGGAGALGGLLGGSKGSLITAAGQVISGLASGAASGKSATAQIQAQIERDRMEADRYASNYGYTPQYNTDAKGRIQGAPTGFLQSYQTADQQFRQPTGLAPSGRTPYFGIVDGRVVELGG